MATKCSAIAHSGSRCTTAVVAGSAFCWMHDPNSAEARREASKRGGKARSAKARAAKLVPDAMTAADLAGWLSLLFTSVLSGKVDPKTGTACAAIAGRLLDAQTAAAQPRIEDLQEQVVVLRTLIERGDRGRVA